MIVRNESKIIRRCLDSVRSVIDGISICDTGSTDNTVELIDEKIKEFGIPGRVHSHTWKHFAHNRSLSYQAAREFAIESEFQLENTYALFLDADMMLMIPPKFKKNDLTKDGYLVIQKGGLSYPNLRLGRMDHRWCSLCVTHEYWAICDEDGKEAKTQDDHDTKTSEKVYEQPILGEDVLWIDDYNDGGCKADKFERDIRLLTQGLIDEPDNIRYHFYLARSYEDNNELENAIAWYTKRVALDGFWEEIWYSYYCMGNCYAKIYDRYNVAIARRNKRIAELEAKEGPYSLEDDPEEKDGSDSEETIFDIDQENSIEKLKQDNQTDLIKRDEAWRMSLERYFDAYQKFSGRAEPLYKIANHYRYDGKYELSYMFAKLGMSVSYPRDATLFIEDAIYDHLLMFEAALSGYYTRYRDDAFGICEEIVFSHDIPDEIRDHIHREMLFYIPKLNANWYREIEIDRPPVENPLVPGSRYLGLNPSIVHEDHGYTLIYRCVNFTHDNATSSYHSMDQDGMIRTRNYLVKLDQLLQPLFCAEIVMGPKFKDRVTYPTQVLGMEDARLFKKDSRYWFSCTTRDTNPAGAPQITLCRLSRQINAEGKLEVDLFTPLTFDPKSTCEKNWLPFTEGNEIFFIYGWDPVRVVIPDVRTGQCKETHVSQNRLDLSRFRGSTSPVPFDFITSETTIQTKKGKAKEVAKESGYLTIVHEVIFRQTNNGDREYRRRHYCHRFVWMDKNFVVKRISRPFYLQKCETEYVCGMCYEHNRSTGSLLITAGINDSQAHVYAISVDRVQASLRNIALN